MKTMFGLMKIVLFFVICTLLFYYGILFLKEKTNTPSEPTKDSLPVQEEGEHSWIDRVELFYYLGE